MEMAPKAQNPLISLNVVTLRASFLSPESR